MSEVALYGVDPRCQPPNPTPKILKYKIKQRSVQMRSVDLGTREAVYGNLVHKKPSNPLGPPQDPRHRPTVGSQGGAFSYERGTPVGRDGREKLSRLPLQAQPLQISQTKSNRSLKPNHIQFSIQSNLKAQSATLVRFRGGLVFKAHRLCVSLNSRLESNK